MYLTYRASKIQEASTSSAMGRREATRCLEEEHAKTNTIKYTIRVSERIIAYTL